MAFASDCWSGLLTMGVLSFQLWLPVAMKSAVYLAITFMVSTSIDCRKFSCYYRIANNSTIACDPVQHEPQSGYTIGEHKRRKSGVSCFYAPSELHEHLEVIYITKSHNPSHLDTKNDIH